MTNSVFKTLEAAIQVAVCLKKLDDASVSANDVFNLIVALKTKQHDYLRTSVGKYYLV